MHDPSQPPAGDNVNFDKLAVLSEPYPQVVAGTPLSWSFDDGTFEFSYSTAAADGTGSFGAASQTVISVPAGQYPDGYQVSVTGGEVISAHNASELVIASHSGATTIQVTVSPAAAG